MKQQFNTSVGTVEVLVDERSRIVSAYRFNTQGRPVAAALESWDHIDLADLLTNATGISAAEAMEIATAVNEELGVRQEESPTEGEAPDGFHATAAEVWATVLAALGALFLLAVALWMILHPGG